MKLLLAYIDKTKAQFDLKEEPVILQLLTQCFQSFF